MLSLGSSAPSVPVTDDQDNTVTLQDFSGRHVVVYAYPKDDTPGCTAEACSFRDQSSAIAQAGAIILGVSPDTPASHRKFKEKYNLNFTLRSGTPIARGLGCLGRKDQLWQDFGRCIAQHIHLRPARNIDQELAESISTDPW